MAKEMSGDKHTVSAFSPTLKAPDGLHTTRSRNRTVPRTAAVSFNRSTLIHTLRQSKEHKHITIVTRINELDPDAPPPTADSVLRPLWHVLFAYVVSGRDCPVQEYYVELPLPSTALHVALLRLGAVHEPPVYRISQSALFQTFGYASDSPAPPFPRLSAGDHPLRPPAPEPHALLYSRFLPHLHAYFTLRAAAQADADLLHSWFAGAHSSWAAPTASSAEHAAQLAAALGDAHTVPVIGSYVGAKYSDDESVIQLDHEKRDVYCELSWAAEDALAARAGAVGPYDRATRILVRDTVRDGPQYVRAWLPSLLHLCFLDEVRTERVLCDAAAMPEGLVGHLEGAGFTRLAHAESVLECTRLRFFELCPF